MKDWGVSLEGRSIESPASAGSAISNQEKKLNLQADR